MGNKEYVLLHPEIDTPMLCIERFDMLLPESFNALKDDMNFIELPKNLIDDYILLQNERYILQEKIMDICNDSIRNKL